MERLRRRLAALFALGLALTLTYVAAELGLVWLVDPDRDRFPVLGIDVSHHQGSIDWAAVGASDVRFVWVKATEGGDWQDPRFADNVAGARREGLSTGAYHFFTFCRPGADQAANFLAALPEELELPPAVDLEFGGNCAAVPEPDALVGELTVFLEAVERETGERPVIYATRSAAERYLQDPSFVGHGLWLRDLLAEPEPVAGRDWTVWQYKSRGRLPGIVGPVDLNVFSGSEEAFARWLES